MVVRYTWRRHLSCMTSENLIMGISKNWWLLLYISYCYNNPKNNSILERPIIQNNCKSKNAFVIHQKNKISFLCQRKTFIWKWWYFYETWYSRFGFSLKSINFDLKSFKQINNFCKYSRSIQYPVNIYVCPVKSF